MIKKGKIVYHKQVIFGDNTLDTKKNRPCVVLFSLEYQGKKYICTCPFTSTIRVFNKYPKKYKFIPEQIYSYRKLSFAKLDSIHLYPEEETYETNYSLMDEYVESIIDGFMNMRINANKESLLEIKKILEYEKLFTELEERELKREKKLLKQQKKRQAKKVVSL